MKIITKEQKLQLVGLKALAKFHNAILEDIRKVTEKTLEVEDGDSYVCDFVYSEIDLDWLLKILEVEIR